MPVYSIFWWYIQTCLKSHPSKLQEVCVRYRQAFENEKHFFSLYFNSEEGTSVDRDIFLWLFFMYFYNKMHFLLCRNLVKM